MAAAISAELQPWFSHAPYWPVASRRHGAAGRLHAALGRGVGAAPIELALFAGAGLTWVLAFLGALVRGRVAESTGPWNSATAIQRGGVLCDGRAAPLVVWHGRRSTATGGAWRAGGPAGRRQLGHVLAAGDPAELAERARGLGLRYLVLGEESAERLARLGADPELFEALREGGAGAGELGRRWSAENSRAVILEVPSPR